MWTERPLGYRQLEARSAGMVEATAVYVSIAMSPASGHTLFNLHSENSLVSTHVDDDESAGYVNCFSGCKSLEMHCSCWSSSHSVGRPSQAVNYDGR
jgi:hypothetical protein